MHVVNWTPDQCREFWRAGTERNISIEEASKRISKAASKWMPGDRREFWGQVAQTPSYPNPLLYAALTRYEASGETPGDAVDLGCGNGIQTFALLARGWRVTAVDSSSGALARLQQRVDELAPRSIVEGQLTLVCQEIEAYEFPKTVRMIVAIHSLPYCNPSKIQGVLEKAHAALECGGRIVGTFCAHAPHHLLTEVHAQENLRIEYDCQITRGMWFTDRPVVNALLNSCGYRQEVCGYDSYQLLSEPLGISFIGQKV